MWEGWPAAGVRRQPALLAGWPVCLLARHVYFVAKAGHNQHTLNVFNIEARSVHWAILESGVHAVQRAQRQLLSPACVGIRQAHRGNSSASNTTADWGIRFKIPSQPGLTDSQAAAA